MDLSLNESERDLVDLCRNFAQQQIAPARAGGLGGGAVSDRSAPRDGGARPPRHARSRRSGAGSACRRRLCRGDGADRPGRPVGGGSLAGARHRSARCPCTCSEPTRSASVGCDRSPRAGALGAFGLTEPDAGSDARGIRTRAERRVREDSVAATPQSRPPTPSPPRRFCRARLFLPQSA